MGAKKLSWQRRLVAIAIKAHLLFAGLLGFADVCSNFNAPLDSAKQFMKAEARALPLLYLAFMAILVGPELVRLKLQHDLAVVREEARRNKRAERKNRRNR